MGARGLTSLCENPEHSPLSFGRGSWKPLIQLESKTNRDRRKRPKVTFHTDSYGRRVGGRSGGRRLYALRDRRASLLVRERLEKRRTGLKAGCRQDCLPHLAWSGEFGN